MIYLDAALARLAGDVVPFDVSKRREHETRLPWGRTVVPPERLERKRLEQPVDDDTYYGLDAMVRQYLETAAWATTHSPEPTWDEESEEYTENPVEVDRLISDGKVQWSRAAIETAKRDCQNFLDRVKQEYPDAADLYPSDLGHDFFLTRNRHGAGFWDGDYEKSLGQLLTRISHEFGEADPYVGDDGLLYFP